MHIDYIARGLGTGLFEELDKLDVQLNRERGQNMKTDKTPKKELDLAKHRLKEVKNVNT